MRSIQSIAGLLFSVLASVGAAELDPLTEALLAARPLSNLSFSEEDSSFLPGKGRGTPDESIGDLGIALIFAQNNYWTSDNWSASGYQVRRGLLSDSQGRLAPVAAYEVSPPTFGAGFQFVASGNDLFFQLAPGMDHVIYSFRAAGLALPSGKSLLAYGNGTLVTEAEISASDVVSNGFTRIPGITLHGLPTARIFCALPKSTTPESATLIAPGVRISRLANNLLGRVSRVSIDVREAGSPYHSYVNQPDPASPYGTTNQLICSAHLDGSLSVFWKDFVTGSFQVTTLRPDLTHPTVRMPASLAMFGSSTRDPEGNWYYLTYDSVPDPAMLLIKAGPDGTEIARRELSYLEFDVRSMAESWNRSHLVFAADKLCLAITRNMASGHTGSIIVTFDPTTLATLRNYGQNASHSFATRILHDGTDFLVASLGDAYPRGLSIDRVTANSKAGRVVYTYKRGTAYQFTHTELGDMTALPTGYGLVFSGEKSNDASLATQSLNEARNIGYLLVAPNFSSIPQTSLLVPENMILSQGETSDIFSCEFGQQQNRGIRWLTDYTDKSAANATRSKLIALGDGRQLLLWEKWTPTAHVSTHGMVIDATGNVLQPEQNLGSTRLANGDRLILAGNRVCGVTADGMQLEWTIVEPDRPRTYPFEITECQHDPASGLLRIRFRTIPGLTYCLQQSATLAPDDWHDLPAHQLTAPSSFGEFPTVNILGGQKMFFRVLEQ